MVAISTRASLCAAAVQLVHLPRGLQREQAGRLHLGVALGDPVLDHLLLGQQRAVRVARESARSHSMSKARLLWPSQRMAWWMRPGPSRFWASSEAVAGVADEVLVRHPHVLVEDLGVAAGLTRACGRARPSSARRGGCSRPGVSVGTMIIEKRRYGSTSGFVMHITIRKSLIDAFDENHLWPLMTHSSPSRTAAW